jgi:CxxC motif-containing protein (DUF1111 family)
MPDGRVGRFGWKAQTATLVEFMGEAQRDELGSPTRSSRATSFTVAERTGSRRRRTGSP